MGDSFVLLPCSLTLLCHVFAGDPQTLLPEANRDHVSVWGVDCWHPAVQQRQEGWPHHVPSCCGTKGNVIKCTQFIENAVEHSASWAFRPYFHLLAFVSHVKSNFTLLNEPRFSVPMLLGNEFQPLQVTSSYFSACKHSLCLSPCVLLINSELAAGDSSPSIGRLNSCPQPTSLYDISPVSLAALLSSPSGSK